MVLFKHARSRDYADARSIPRPLWCCLNIDCRVWCPVRTNSKTSMVLFKLTTVRAVLSHAYLFQDLYGAVLTGAVGEYNGVIPVIPRPLWCCFN